VRKCLRLFAVSAMEWRVSRRGRSFVCGKAQRSALPRRTVEGVDQGEEQKPCSDGEGILMATVWIYVDSRHGIRDTDHVRGFASADAARAWFAAHDPEGVGFEYPVKV
jgi:hypothetical protein